MYGCQRFDADTKRRSSRLTKARTHSAAQGLLGVRRADSSQKDGNKGQQKH